MRHESETKPHVLPLKVYLGVAGFLYLMTIITVAVAQVHLGPFNLFVAMVIAVLKAVAVALIFMHLLFDNKMYMSFFLISIVFVGIFLTITMFDTMRRGDIYEEVARPIKSDAVIYQDMKPVVPHQEKGH